VPKNSLEHAGAYLCNDTDVRELYPREKPKEREREGEKGRERLISARKADNVTFLGISDRLFFLYCVKRCSSNI